MLLIAFTGNCSFFKMILFINMPSFSSGPPSLPRSLARSLLSLCFHFALWHWIFNLSFFLSQARNMSSHKHTHIENNLLKILASSQLFAPNSVRDTEKSREKILISTKRKWKKEENSHKNEAKKEGGIKRELKRKFNWTELSWTELNWAETKTKQFHTDTHWMTQKVQATTRKKFSERKNKSQQTISKRITGEIRTSTADIYERASAGITLTRTNAYTIVGIQIIPGQLFHYCLCWCLLWSQCRLLECVRVCFVSIFFSLFFLAHNFHLLYTDTDTDTRHAEYGKLMDIISRPNEKSINLLKNR